jgi:energy-coupling factor transporter ATP-binding protein EcfA2
MSDPTPPPTTTDIEPALERLLARVRDPRALVFRKDDQSALEAAVQRARAQISGAPEPVLVVALAGGTGAGKSTLINALAGGVIAAARRKRPTTTALHVYHHRDISGGGLPNELAAKAVSAPPHDRPELRNKVLIDTPDLDSFATEHRSLTKQLLKAAGLVLYVFTPDNYEDERVWGVLREEQRFSRCAAVLNKTDRFHSLEELEAVTEALRRKFADMGAEGIRIFRTCAGAAVPDEDGRRVRPVLGVDDLPALRAYLERELQDSDVARMVRAQRERVVGHLRAEVDRLAPPDLPARLEKVAVFAKSRVEGAADRLIDALQARLAAVESELAPLTVLRQHERFRGPLRTWLAVADFFRFGLTGIVRGVLRGGQRRGERSAIEDLLTGVSTVAVDDVLRDEARAIQDRLFADGLPVARWSREAGRIDAARLLAETAAEIDRLFESALAHLTKRGRIVVWTASFLGGAVPAVVVVGGLYAMAEALFKGEFLGLPLLGHLLAMLVMFFLALHGISGALLPGGRKLARGVAPAAARTVLTRTLTRWFDAYRADLEADLADLREPLDSLMRTVTAAPDGTGAAARPQPAA